MNRHRRMSSGTQYVADEPMFTKDTIPDNVVLRFVVNRATSKLRNLCSRLSQVRRKHTPDNRCLPPIRNARIENSKYTHTKDVTEYSLNVVVRFGYFELHSGLSAFGRHAEMIEGE
jgi:hypothetical protein